ncbi:MAG: hypothetical protein Q7S74_05250 [Nanoarchaeota archaeon]|nr:hypothetical protein [Nanoarchaeota archaeon]
MKVKNFVLGIGIVIVFALALWQGIEAFYPSPQYDKFCNSSMYAYAEPYPVKPYSYEAPNCTFSRTLQEQANQCTADGGQPIYDYDDNGCTTSLKKCDFCNKQFNDKQNTHAKNVFWIALIAGIVTLIIGYFILSIEPVGSALIGSAIWAIFYGTVINWRNFSNIWRFLILFIALILLIWIAIRLNVAKEKKGFWAKLGLKK